MESPTAYIESLVQPKLGENFLVNFKGSLTMHEPAKSVSQICRGKRWGVIASYSGNNEELVMTVEIVV